MLGLVKFIRLICCSYTLDDPVNIFGYLHRCPDSLLKFFEDIFSSETTSGLFFTNDLMVLIDIVLRQVSDLSPGDEVCIL